MKVKNQLLSLALTLVLAVILLPTTALADVGDEFTYEHEGVTLNYIVTSEEPYEAAVTHQPDEDLLALAKTATSITVPEQVTTQEGVSYTVTSTQVYDIDGLAYYGPFTDFENLQSVTLPDTITTIGKNSFAYCSSLKSISLPENLTTIVDRAFSNCSSLETISLPEGLTTIGASAFSGCSSLKSISLSESLTTIGEAAFGYCRSLKSISLPEGITRIEDGAFQECTSLQSISIPDSVTSIGSAAFQMCHALESISLPDSITTIETKAFLDCTSLKYISLPDGLDAIGANVFRHCASLESISLPESLTTIGAEAFSYCYSLDKLYFDGSFPSIGTIPFFNAKQPTIYYNPNHDASWSGERLSGLTPQSADYPTDLPDHATDINQIATFSSIEISEAMMLPTTYNGYKLVWSVTSGDAIITDNNLIAMSEGNIRLSVKQLTPLKTPDGLYSRLTKEGEEIPSLVTTITAFPLSDTGTDGDTDSNTGSTGGSVKAPKLLEGGEQTIVAGSPLTIKTNGRIEEYLYTRINGEIIPEKYLTLKSGSVIVTLKPDYTSTLPAGEHEISVVSNTGATKTTFTIADSSDISSDDSTTAMETLTPATEVTTPIKENPSTGR